ncbi:hypothetical protein GUITHDRAFT_120670 [Guillardia theta CCMP2712]|uniref:Uncharacterized protein n=1 Tax=Guillardia theta (strain CCMP2712) TaxID=905079 RepID=L1IB54_GUITC|nr:hypothetical protein GUITHDRAFT_120670 [Guillardia theta CCMP2712]EKX33149.1 hypothetical protein GUITHDRAFT_120670 [Guillardia theta CCMP2712]|mmetsp:Transcript_44181/g.139385  ORF Transcript_44181/g.139385 Transcript_44181/m.139385 type:complete len:86 (+) Transcript_44181:302-559(+)|eukprot:XP_005820129.1 hypothetical protein GUITHDRAFT_120670 [Guillardia theta CCMP2712]
MPDMLGFLLSYCGCPRARGSNDASQQELDSERARYESMLDLARDNPTVSGTDVEKAFVAAKSDDPNANTNVKKSSKANSIGRYRK